MCQTNEQAGSVGDRNAKRVSGFCGCGQREITDADQQGCVRRGEGRLVKAIDTAFAPVVSAADRIRRGQRFSDGDRLRISIVVEYEIVESEPGFLREYTEGECDIIKAALQDQWDACRVENLTVRPHDSEVMPTEAELYPPKQ